MNRSNRKPLMRPLIALMSVLIISLVMLIYIAYVDAYQSYTTFLLGRLNSNTEIIEHAIEPRLQAGLPLSQLVGFDIITNPLIANDDVVYDVTIVDTENAVLFQNIKPNYTPPALADFRALSLDNKQDYVVYQTNDIFQIRAPLDARFNQPGTLLISMPAFVIKQLVNSYINTVIYFAIIIVIIYSIIIFILLKRQKVTNLALNIVYNVGFVIVATFLTGTLIQIYSNGVQEQAKALANSLSVRFGSAIALGLELEDFEGIEQVLIDYKILNADIAYVSLLENDQIISHTDPENIGKRYAVSPGVIEYREAISNGIDIAVAIPQRLIFQRLIRNIKNFAVLFLASAFLSWLLLRILLSVYSDVRSDLAHNTLSSTSLKVRAVLDLIFPAFFLANFAEALHYSYLPQYLSQLATDSGFSTGSVGGAYAIFWAAYALILIPAGKIARTMRGVRKLLGIGFILISISMLLLIVFKNFTWIYLIRALSGFGQGMIFIAVQSYILQLANEDQRTEGVSIIVYGYNGGVISGTVIGSLLVSSLGFDRLFLISAIIAFLMMWYSLSVIANKRREDVTRTERSSTKVRESIYTYGSSGLSVQKGFLHNVKLLFSDFEFVKTVAFIGLLTKAVLAGVVFLALPHFLSVLEYRQEDIGQILMFYAGGVLLISRLIARYTDRIGSSRRILFFGTISSGIGLAIISTAQRFSYSVPIQTSVLVFGILVLGLSHGFVHAPIVTHITRAPASNAIGKTVAASIYRFVERIGHVIGPLIFGQLLLQINRGIGSLLYIGITVVVGGLLFYFLPQSTKMTHATEKQGGK